MPPDKLEKLVERRIETIRKIVDIQAGAIKVRFWLTFTIVSIGVLIIATSHVITGETVATLKWPFTIGGGFVSSLAAFPVRDIFARKVRITLLGALKEDFTEATTQKRVGELDKKFDKMAERMA